jgi:large subunit ribosomal protein L2
MGKRIIPRARGAGGPRYRSPSHRFVGKVEYLPYGSASGKVLDIVRDAIHSAPLAVVRSDDGRRIVQVAAEGVMVGDRIDYCKDVRNGNVVELSKVSEGMKVFGIETFPGSGPKLCRGSGVFAFVTSKNPGRVGLQFTTGKIREFDDRCRVSVGVPAGGGMKDKPWMSVGKKWHAKYARGAKIYPRSAGVNMTPADHPYGGKSKRPRPSRTVSRHAPPGKKVGSIAARRVGKRRGARNA